MFWSNELQVEAIQTMLTHSDMYLLRNITLFEDGEMTAEFSRIYKHKAELAHGKRVMMEIASDL